MLTFLSQPYRLLTHSARFDAQYISSIKVRSMWTTVTETFAGLEKEREVVDSVVKGHVDQYTLDGTDITINIPRLLLDKIENEMYRVSGSLNSKCLFFLSCIYRTWTIIQKSVVGPAINAIEIENSGLLAQTNIVH